MGGAGTHDFHQGKALYLHSFFHQFPHHHRIVGRSSPHIRSAGSDGQFAHIEVFFDMAIRRSLGDAVSRRCTGILSPGLPIVVVVGNDGRHIDVPACRMDQMVPADGRPVSIAHGA